MDPDSRRPPRPRKTRPRNTRPRKTEPRKTGPRKTGPRNTRSTRNTGAVTVTVTDGRGRDVRAPGLASWLSRVAPASARGDIGIAIVSDVRIRALNRRFRRMDRVTDVLSFDPSDIVIAKGVARRQARAAGHAYATELKVLALHGLLHLLGYDHHRPDDRGRMARLERRLRAKGGLREGLIERGSMSPRRRGPSDRK